MFRRVHVFLQNRRLRQGDITYSKKNTDLKAQPTPVLFYTVNFYILKSFQLTFLGGRTSFPIQGLTFFNLNFYMLCFLLFIVTNSLLLSLFILEDNYSFSCSESKKIWQRITVTEPRSHLPIGKTGEGRSVNFWHSSMTGFPYYQSCFIIYLPVPEILWLMSVFSPEWSGNEGQENILKINTRLDIYYDYPSKNSKIRFPTFQLVKKSCEPNLFSMIFPYPSNPFSTTQSCLFCAT